MLCPLSMIWPQEVLRVQKPLDKKDTEEEEDKICKEDLLGTGN